MKSFLKNLGATAEQMGDDDFARVPVAENAKRGWVSGAIVYTGCAVSISAFSLGGALASGLTLTQSIIAIILGSMVLVIMAAICAKVALYTGLSTSMIGKFTFGQRGAAIVGLLYAGCAWGWFGVQAGLFGDTVSVVYNLVTGKVLSVFALKTVIIVGGLLMTSTAIFGYKSLEWLSWVVLPVLTTLMVASLFAVVRQGNTYASLNSAFISSPMSLGAGISAVIASFAAGAVGSPDIMRYSKNLKDVVISMTLGLMVGFGSTIFIAAVCAKAVGEANIVNIMVGLGWGFLAMAVLVLAQWNANDNNVYSGSLGFSVVFEKLPKYWLAVITGVTGTLCAVLGISNKLIPFFSILGIFTPPLGGCYVADFFMNQKYYDFENLENVPRIRKETIIAYFVAAGVGFLVTPPSTGLGLFQITTVPALDTFLIALVLQVICVKLFNKDLGKSLK